MLKTGWPILSTIIQLWSGWTNMVQAQTIKYKYNFGDMIFLSNMGDNFSIEIRTQVTRCFPSFGLFHTACYTRRILSWFISHPLLQQHPGNICTKSIHKGSLYYRPKQGTIKGENPQNYHAFALFDSAEMGNYSMIPVHFPGLKSFKLANILWCIDHDWSWFIAC